MSTLFEGFIVPQPPAAIAPQLPLREGAAHLAIVPLRTDVSVVVATNPRSEGGHAAEVRKAAANASVLFNQALFVVYNDQAGDRYSEYYENGRRIAEFGARDELYVSLDENGCPDRQHPPLRLADLATDLEYETIVNAIQLGLRRIGAPDMWDDIRRLAATT